MLSALRHQKKDAETALISIAVTDSFIETFNANFTIEVYAEKLRGIEEEFRGKLELSHGADSAQRRAMEQSLAEVIRRLEDIEDAHSRSLKTYASEIKRLGELTASLPAHAVQQAQKRLSEGDSIRAEELLEKAAEIAEREASKSRLEAADSLRGAAELAFERFDFPKARERFTKSLELDPDSPAAARGLGNALFSLGEFNESANWLERAIGLRKSSPRFLEFLSRMSEFGFNTDYLNASETLVDLRRLISIASGKSDHEGTLLLMQRSLDLQRAVFDPDGTSPVYRGMCIEARATRAIIDGEDFTEVDRLGEDWDMIRASPALVGSLEELLAANRLSNALTALERYGEAIPSLERVVDLIGEFHSEAFDLAAPRVNFAKALAECGRGDEAYARTLEALEIFGNIQTSMHVCSNIGNTLSAEGFEDLALLLFKRAEKLSAELVGVNSVERSNLLQAMANIYLRNGDYLAARTEIEAVRIIFLENDEATLAAAAFVEIGKLDDMLAGRDVVTTTTPALPKTGWFQRVLQKFLTL